MNYKYTFILHFAPNFSELGKLKVVREGSGTSPQLYNCRNKFAFGQPFSHASVGDQANFYPTLFWSTYMDKIIQIITHAMSDLVGNWHTAIGH